jgi:twitching motility protein PilT
MPPISSVMLRGLLGELWSSHQATLQDQGRVRTTYHSTDLGDFEVTLSSAGDDAGETVLFVRPHARREAFGEVPAAHGAPTSVQQEPARDTVTTSPDGSELGNVAPLLRDLLSRAVAMGASDVHLSETSPPVVRVHGELSVLDGEPATEIAALLETPEQRAAVRAGQSVDIGLDLQPVGRLRVNVYSSSEGLVAAIRILAQEAPRLSELNLPVEVGSLIELPHGLVIVCGPTGSGKSSTLAALAQAAIAKRPGILISLEDPVEYRIRPRYPTALVRQRQIGMHVRDFATGLRDALREDPDILLIGEMRDPETISLALTAAETGHLVLTSLHSRTAASAVERIVDTYAPERQRQIRVQLADALRAVIAQRLLPRVQLPGRLPAVEILRVTHAVGNLIREGRTAQIASAMQSGADDGMLPLEKHLADLVRTKVVHPETARAAANDVSTLKQYLAGP